MRGMGRVFKRGSIYWIAYSFNGKEHRESSYSDSEAKARKLLKKRLGEMGTGKLIGPAEGRLTFEEMSQDFIRDYEVNRKRSLNSAKLSVSHLKAFFGLDRAMSVTTDRVRANIAQRQSEKTKRASNKTSNASTNRELAALKRMFSLAVQAGKLSARPYIPMLEENNARQGFLDHNCFVALRNALPVYLKDPVTFLYLSGWRGSEMRALEWRDVDLLGNVIRLRPEISKNKDGRILPLGKDLREIILRAYHNRQPDCVFVFHHEGQPIGDFRKSWNSALQEADLRGIIVHDLRRTVIRNLIHAGVPERVPMALSGHKTRAIFDRYDVVSESDLAEAAEKLQQHLEQQAQRSKQDQAPQPEAPKVAAPSEIM